MRSYKKIFVLLFLAVVIGFGMTERAFASNTSVSAVNCVDIAGGYGKGISVEFTPVLGTNTYWNPIDTSKLELRNQFGEIVPITSAETVGDQIAINRGLGFNYYGWTLTIDEGFQVIRTDDSTSYPGITTEKVTYIFKGSTTNGGYWEIYNEPTSLTIENVTVSIKVGETSHQIVANVLPETSNVVKTYKSADSNIASVSGTGEITAINEGNTTVTVHAGTLVETINVTVEASELPQTGIIVTTPDKLIITYKGYNYDLNKLTAVKVYEGGGTGEQVIITSDMISGTFNKDETGDYTLTLTDGTFTDTFTVSVVEIPEITVKGTTPGSDFGNNSPWGTPFYIVFNSPDIAQYLNLKDEAFENVKSHISFAGRKDVLSNMKNLGGGRYEFWLAQDFSFKAGDKIIFEAGMGLWQYKGGVIDANHDATLGEYVLIGELKSELTYVYTGSNWAIYTGEPTDFELSIDLPFISVGSSQQLSYSVSPDGTYGTPVFTSSDDSIATVNESGEIVGMAEGQVIITATIGSVVKTIDVTITPAKTITGVELTDAYIEYYVVKDSLPSLFNPNISKARLIFEDGTKSPEFTLAPSDYTIEDVNTSIEGTADINVIVTYNEVSYETSITINVYEYYDQKVTEVGIVDWFAYAVFIQLPNTSTNEANITTSSLMPNILENITYTRIDGTVVPIQGFYMLATNIAIFPSFLYEDGQMVVNADNYNQYYLEGDMITINGNTPIYKWTGSKNADNSIIEGTGELIIEGYIPVTVQYRYNGNIWGVYIEYTDIEVENSEIDIKIGESKTTGVVRVPENATTGKFTYTSSDNSILQITENGIMKGLKEGTVTVTVTISDPNKPSSEKSIELTVHVKDYITGIKFGNTVTLTKGSKLDLSKIEANYVWASGKIGEKVDLTTASISGLDESTIGEQNAVVSVKIDNVTYSGQLTVKVVDSNVMLYIVLGGIFGVIVIASGVIFFKKKLIK